MNVFLYSCLILLMMLCMIHAETVEFGGDGLKCSDITDSEKCINNCLCAWQMVSQSCVVRSTCKPPEECQMDDSFGCHAMLILFSIAAGCLVVSMLCFLCCLFLYCCCNLSVCFIEGIKHAGYDRV